MSYAPDQYLSDTFKFWDDWEVLTPDVESEQVVVRMSYKIQWVNKPWLLGGQIEDAIINKVRLTDTKARQWFP